MNREPARYQVKVFWLAFCFGMYFRRHHTCFYCRTVPFVLKKQSASVSARTNAKILVSHRFAGHKKKCSRPDRMGKDDMARKIQIRFI